MNIKYHIETREAKSRLAGIGKFEVVRDEKCINCGRCIRECSFSVHARREEDPRLMAEPRSHLCKNCFRCVQACPAGALRLIINPDYKALGDDYWKSEYVVWLWTQAENGKVPVRGAGYRGPFSGPGFDSMWTDMSEIVRPTRDGIHGREYISTAIDLGRKPKRLEFDALGNITARPAPIIDIPLPILLDVYPSSDVGEGVQGIMLGAAAKLQTLAMVSAPDYEKHLFKYDEYAAPRVDSDTIGSSSSLLERAKLIEIDHSKDIEDDIRRVRVINEGAVISVRIPMKGDFVNMAFLAILAGAGVIHLRAGEKAEGDLNGEAIHLMDGIRNLHLHLVEQKIRDEVSLIVGGGIAMAEHLPKAVILGADGVVMDRALRIALECRTCEHCAGGLNCPYEISKISNGWGIQRIVNLIGAFHDQLLEVMGAMGIREIRRLRGEIGRSMRFEDLERDIFGRVFSKGAQG